MPDGTTERRDKFWDHWPFDTGRGLEIGPLHRTVVPRERADVRYVDVHDRSGLLEHYAGDSDIDPDLIPEIDYVLVQPDGRVLSLVEVAAEGAPFTWVVASHVIEHVPDVIGWLDQVAEIVEDCGALVLAVPDRRYCFDVNRPPTTVGQMLQAHLDRDTRPSVRAVYDYMSSVVSYDLGDLWHHRTPTFDQRIHSLGEAEAKVAQTTEGHYVDSHVWLFSPQSFLEQMHELRITGRSAWTVETLTPTPYGDLEFTVVMRRIPRGVDTTSSQDGELLAETTRPDWIVAPEVYERIDELEGVVRTLEARLEKRRDRLRRVRATTRQRTEADRATIDALRRELRNVRTSRRWRLATALAAPATTLRRRRHR